jgi:2-polyprenyl-3-methyl-5-hydroxy-6-metoxy-1,4-benzoquinol methylase
MAPASRAGSNPAPSVEQGSPDRFGYEWSTYSEILPESKAQLSRWLGSTGLASFAGKRVMDVGCGMGRNPYWMLDAGAKEVVAVDVDDGSLAAARKNLAKFENARVVKGSAYDLSSDELGLFDRVTCIGVLHHLDDPRQALQRMWSCVAPGGDLVLWCYAKEGNRLMLPVIQAFRAVGSRLPITASHAIAKGITFAAWPAIRFIPWRTDYYRALGKLSFKNVESIVFDQMLPHIAHYWTRREMSELAAALPGGTPFVEFVQGNSWHVRVAKRGGDFTSARGALMG